MFFPVVIYWEQNLPHHVVQRTLNKLTLLSFLFFLFLFVFFLVRFSISRSKVYRVICFPRFGKIAAVILRCTQFQHDMFVFPR